jgi:hypothetical protein
MSLRLGSKFFVTGAWKILYGKGRMGRVTGKVGKELLDFKKLIHVVLQSLD